MFEGSRDFLGAFMRYGFEGYQEVLDNAKKTAMPRYMPVFEKVIRQRTKIKLKLNYNNFS